MLTSTIAVSGRVPSKGSCYGILGNTNVFFTRFPFLKRLSCCRKIYTHPPSCVPSGILSSECHRSAAPVKMLPSSKQLLNWLLVPSEVAAALRLMRSMLLLPRAPLAPGVKCLAVYLVAPEQSVPWPSGSSPLILETSSEISSAARS